MTASSASSASSVAHPPHAASCHASPRLLADIGGTNARFALELGPGRIERIEVLACAAYPTLRDAVQAYLASPAVGADRLAPVRHAAIAIANPVTGDDVRMTNHHWAFSIEALRTGCG